MANNNDKSSSPSTTPITTTTAAAAKPRDPTFRNYAPSAAQSYANHRPAYPDTLISAIIDHHTSTCGQLDLLLDVGCGPGTATRSLSPFFNHAIGADPGTAMIETARGIPSTTKSGDAIRYEVCGAEDLDKGIAGLQAGSVDLITAATAAHWFDMERFYVAAARVLKPGGTIMLWTSGSFFVNPHTTPNAAKVQEILNELEHRILDPYYLPGNIMCRDLYAKLPLPWSIPSTEDHSQLAMLDESTFLRREYNKDGVVPPGETLLMGKRLSFGQIRLGLGTASMVTRWREANKEELDAGQMQDCVEVTVRRVREAVDEVEEGVGRDWIEAGAALVLLGIKKKPV